MGFEERVELSKNMENVIIEFLTSKGFILDKTGYESHVSKETREILRKIHNDATVTFLRYMPDYFARYRDSFFFIELKIMDSPIKLDSRINDLRKVTGLNNLSKQNIGVIETAAIRNYQNLGKLDVKILTIIYSTFHPKKLLVDWEKNIKPIYNDEVKLGQGNASFTPFTNINLDNLQDFTSFFKKEFNLTIVDKEIVELISKIK